MKTNVMQKYWYLEGQLWKHASKAGGTTRRFFNLVGFAPQTPWAVGKPTATPADAGEMRPALEPATIDLKVHSNTH